MFKNWTKILTADCEVLKIASDIFVYPIYKNGRSSCMMYAEQNKSQIFKNREIQKLGYIYVFLRDPEERFISGVHTYLEFNEIKNRNRVLKDIEKFKTYDRHFVPQLFWLLHLYKFYRGCLLLRPITDLYKLLPNRDVPKFKNKKLAKPTKKQIAQIRQINFEHYVDMDKELIAYSMNKDILIENLIKKFAYVLS
jgi:hypothetical protein